MLIRLASRNIGRQTSRTLLTLGSIGIGVASLVLAAGFIDDILAQLREATIRSQLGHFQVYARGYLDAGGRDPLAHTVERYGDAVARLRAIRGVRTIAPRLTFPGLVSNGRSQWAVTIEGVDPEAEAQIGTSLARVAGSTLREAPSAAVAGEGVARALKLDVGDPLTLLAATREGALNTADLPLAGVFRSPFKDFDARAVRIRLRDAQELANERAVNALVVLLDGVTPEEDALAAARAALPADAYDIRPWWRLADFYQGTVALYRRQFLVLQVIVSLMVVLGVANSINMSLHERQSEFGTARALGYRPGAIVGQILTEAALIGVIAAIAGTLLGAGLALAISSVGIEMPPPPNSDVGYTATIRLSAASLALAAGIGIAASVVGAAVPAWRLSRMPIVDALRHAI